MTGRQTRSEIPETLLDEAYLLILSRRPTAGDLARELRVSKSRLGQLLRRLSAGIRQHGLLVHRAGKGDRRVLEIRTVEDPTLAAPVDPRTLRARRLPPRRPGLKPEDEIIYARDW